MPSNEFQQLVYLIQRQMKTRPDAVVSESKRLRDRNSGKRREVDVVVEFTESGVPFILAFECQSRGRKPGIEWVEHMIKKHEHLSDKLVLVAHRPLTTDAVDEASRHGVETIDHSTALQTNWLAFIDRYKEFLFASFDFTPKEFHIEYERLTGDRRLSNAMEVTVTQGAQRASYASLHAVVYSVLRDRGIFGKPAMSRWYKLPLDSRRDEHTIDVRVATPADAPPWILTQGDCTYRLTKLTASVTVKVGSAPLVLGSAQYGVARVAHATATLDKGSMAGQTVRLVMTERQGEQPKAELAFVDGKKPQPRTVELELQPKLDDS